MPRYLRLDLFSKWNRASKNFTLIEQKVEKGTITLLLPEIVITEFERNIPNAIHSGVQAKLAEIEKNIDVLNSFLGEGDNPTFMDFVLEQKVEVEVFRNYRKDFKKIKTLIIQL